MTPAQVAALGVVQGVAEVVPVSSSAQLTLLPWLLGWEQPADRTSFAAGLHAGSCAGIAWALRSELLALEMHDLVTLAAASAPAAVAGLLAADTVEQRLGRPPQLAVLLAAAGALLWWADARAERRARGGALLDTPGVSSSGAPPADRPAGRRAVGAREAAYAGLAQVAALVPGVSRSGATLTALRLAGVDRQAAARFTLLLSLPVTAGAAGLTLARTPGRRRATALRLLAPGAVTAALAGATTLPLVAGRGGGQARAAAVYRLGLAAVVVRRLLREGGS
jgi:undecaprenyl-diphosphatase